MIMILKRYSHKRDLSAQWFLGNTEVLKNWEWLISRLFFFWGGDAIVIDIVLLYKLDENCEVFHFLHRLLLAVCKLAWCSYSLRVPGIGCNSSIRIWTAEF